MAQILVRNLEDDVKEKLRRRARLHGRSTEEEVREILRNAVRRDQSSTGMLGQRLRALFAEVGLEEDLPQLPRQPARPADLDQ
jgi:plasmid stability protein